MAVGTDWVEWHRGYERPGSSLGRRLGVVRRRLDEVLVGATRETVVLSLCAGDGRDVVGSSLPGGPARAVLVEVDRDLCRQASRAAAEDEQIEVRCGDASDVAMFADVLPADVLLLCGILGNVQPLEVPQIVRRAMALVRPGGRVIWTRGGGDPDRRPEVRAAFIGAGFEELSFDGAPEPFGVGVSRWPHATAGDVLDGEPLFTFIR